MKPIAIPRQKPFDITFLLAAWVFSNWSQLDGVSLAAQVDYPL